MWTSSLSGIVPYPKFKNSFKRTGLFLNSLIHLVWLYLFFDFLDTPSLSSLAIRPLRASLPSCPVLTPWSTTPSMSHGPPSQSCCTCAADTQSLISPLLFWGVLGAEHQRMQLHRFIIGCRGLLGLQPGLGSQSCSAVLVILCLPSSLLQRQFSTFTAPLIPYFYFREKMEAWTPSFLPMFFDFVFFPLCHIMLDFVSLFAWYRHLEICAEWKTAISSPVLLP